MAGSSIPSRKVYILFWRGSGSYSRPNHLQTNCSWELLACNLVELLARIFGCLLDMFGSLFKFVVIHDVDQVVRCSVQREVSYADDWKVLNKRIKMIYTDMIDEPWRAKVAMTKRSTFAFILYMVVLWSTLFFSLRSFVSANPFRSKLLSVSLSLDECSWVFHAHELLGIVDLPHPHHSHTTDLSHLCLFRTPHHFTKQADCSVLASHHYRKVWNLSLLVSLVDYQRPVFQSTDSWFIAHKLGHLDLTGLHFPFHRSSPSTSGETAPAKPWSS